MNNKVDLKELEKKLDEMNNKKKKKKYILITLSIVFLIGVIYSTFNIITNLLDKKEVAKQENEIMQIIEVEEIEDVGEAINPPNDRTGLYWEFINYKMIDVDINKLKEKNSDTVGWIFVNNTNINYPVVQAVDNDYYLDHQFDKTQNSAGWVFMDYRNNKHMEENKNTIIYGHGLKNRAIFGSLKYTLESKWYNNQENYVVKTVDENNSYLWQVFSIYTLVTNNDYIQTDFVDDADYEKFLSLIKGRSIKDFGVQLNKDDKIITLSTCYTDEKKLVLHAKLIKKS